MTAPARHSAEPALPGVALVRGTSEMFRPYGVGGVQKVKNGIVKIEFSPSVFMPPPYR